MERRIFQGMVAVLSLVPIGGGLAGILLGPSFFDGAKSNIDLDSNYSYLSGLLLGIGLGFWSCIPKVEAKTARFRILAAIVVVGGLSRLLTLALAGTPSAVMLFALGMELAVTPALAIWQSRLATWNGVAPPTVRARMASRM